MTLRVGYLLPGYSTLSEGINGPVRGTVRTRDGDVTAICKSLPKRALLVEVLCARLGCQLGLPIPEPLWVIHSETQADLFGSVDTDYPSLRQLVKRTDTAELKNRLLRWKDFPRAVGFDAWIANSDRNRGNILHDGGSNFWLIDHDQALNGAADQNNIPNSLLDLAATQDEVTRRRIKNALSTVLPTWMEYLIDEAATDLQGYIEIESLMTFLRERRILIATLVSRRFEKLHYDIFH
jgi:hypothetical protein